MKVESTTTNKTFVAFTDQVRFGAHSGLKSDVAALPKSANVGSRTKQKPRDIGDASSLLTPRLLLLSLDEP
jgi:hypothetical protein